MEVLYDRNPCERSVWYADCIWSNGAYDDSGDTEHCSCHKHNTKHRDYAAVYQLWRNFGHVSSIGNGTCPKCIKSDRIKKETSGGRKRGSGKRRKTEKKRKKKKSKVGYYLYAVVVLILTIAILVVSTLILFHVQKIEVKGTNYSKKNDIIKWVQEDQYTSNALYALCKFKLGSNKIPPYLEKVQVGLSAPWALKVTVKEKTRIGCVATDEGYAYFDKEGMVLWEKAEKIEEIPLLEGLDVETSELYEKLPVDEEEVFSYFVELTKEMKKHKLNSGTDRMGRKQYEFILWKCMCTAWKKPV